MIKEAWAKMDFSGIIVADWDYDNPDCYHGAVTSLSQLLLLLRLLRRKLCPVSLPLLPEQLEQLLELLLPPSCAGYRDGNQGWHHSLLQHRCNALVVGSAHH
ncbi:hypothetical protein E2562_036227 [Oryza meyeriana var. granulata]|uniref:Uncharacterized protein n=1 Tax=Oryza meyeriana var. granulata TaxID=110450 RepID=A0A6G1ET64_9ORYZ|nr:hypothetical protein E2562_036227 [Oryza meyeriana var. granulata]